MDQHSGGYVDSTPASYQQYFQSYNLREAADIDEFPSDTCAVEGEGVFFRVVVKGHPQPSLTW